MVQLKVLWTKTALRQRNHIFEYWNKRNKNNEYSKKLNIKIIERLSSLKSQPRLGKKSDFKDIRIVSLGHYSILYKFDKKEIIIVGFWDNRQDPNKLLKILQD
jgi:Plasmid stabilization system protein